MNKTRIIYIIFAICLLFSTTVACSITETHTHVWADATCVSPQTCTVCRETQGTALGHKYNGSTCSQCGASKNYSGSYDGSQVTITVAHAFNSSAQVILDETIADFNHLYPNITIEHMSYGDYEGVFDQINNESSVGLYHNIVICYPEHISLFKLSNSIVNLESLTHPDYQSKISGFYDENACYGDGKIHSLPLAYNTDVLYYNKTFFTQHNLSVPTTWEEMWTLCEIIKEIDPDCIPLAYENESNWFITMAEQLNADYTDVSKEGTDRFAFNNTQMKGFIEELRGYYEKDYFITELLCSSYIPYLFADSGCYMSIGTHIGANHYCHNNPNEVGIAVLPQVDKSNPKVLAQGPSLCMFESDNDQEIYASWLFMEYLSTNPTFQAKYSMCSGYIPTVQSAKNEPAYAAWLNSADSFNNINALALKTAFSQQNAHFTTDAFVDADIAANQVGQLLTECVIEVFDPDQTLDQFIDKRFQDAVDKCLS